MMEQLSYLFSVLGCGVFFTIELSYTCIYAETVGYTESYSSRGDKDLNLRPSWSQTKCLPLANLSLHSPDVYKTSPLVKLLSVKCSRSLFLKPGKKSEMVSRKSPHVNTFISPVQSKHQSTAPGSQRPLPKLPKDIL